MSYNPPVWNIMMIICAMKVSKVIVAPALERNRKISHEDTPIQSYFPTGQAKKQRRRMKYKTISEEVELIAKKIVDAAYIVHKILGPGLLEKVYEVCFCHEISKQELKYQR